MFTADIARADLIRFTAAFFDGSKGAGSFQLREPCVVCTADSGLNSFTLSVRNINFYSESITYFSDLNALSGSLQLENGHLVLTPSGRIHYSDGTGRSIRIWNGEYEVDETVFTSPSISTEASHQIFATPEPSSVLLLLTALAVMAKFIRKTRTV